MEGPLDRVRRTTPGNETPVRMLRGIRTLFGLFPDASITVDETSVRWLRLGRNRRSGWPRPVRGADWTPAPRIRASRQTSAARCRRLIVVVVEEKLEDVVH